MNEARSIMSPMSPELINDGQETVIKINDFLEKAKPIIADSNLIEGSTVSVNKTDVDKIREMMVAIAPPSESNTRLYAHLELTSVFARKIGEKLISTDEEKYGQINLCDLESLALLHDIGRFFTHRWFRNDLVGEVFLKKLNLRHDLMDNLSNGRTEVHLSKQKNRSIDEKVDELISTMSMHQKIIEMADFCGKRKSDGGINTFEETMDYHKKSRSNYKGVSGLEPVWISEKQLSGEIVDLGTVTYEKLKKEFESTGVDFGQIRNEILEEEEKK